MLWGSFVWVPGAVGVILFLQATAAGDTALDHACGHTQCLGVAGGGVESQRICRLCLSSLGSTCLVSDLAILHNPVLVNFGSIMEN